MSIRVSSDAFDDGEVMPDRYSHSGGNVSPPLDWEGIPPGTVELVVTCQDPDAGAQPFVHWILTGLDPEFDGLGEGEQPAEAVLGTNGFGEVGYGGPEPPPGEQHRYLFTVLALGEASGFPPRGGPDELRAAVEQRELDRGTIVGLFG